MRVIKALHGSLVFRGRARRLAELLSAHVPEGARVLDVGCGDGTVAALVRERVPGVRIEGVEVRARSACKVACREFDGLRLPYEDNAFDLCMFVDVLHHTREAQALIGEAARVSRRYVLIKDHLCESAFDGMVLRFMDWVGNRPYGVVLEYEFAGRREWDERFGRAGLAVARWDDRLGLYPWPADMLFGRGLHFISLLESTRSRQGDTV